MANTAKEAGCARTDRVQHAGTSRPIVQLTPEQVTAVMKRLTRIASPAARLVARRLLDLDHGDGAYPGYLSVARHVGLSDGTVRQAILELRRLGAFISQREGGRGNLKVYYGVPVEEWPLHVNGIGNTESGTQDGAVLPPMVPPMVPPMLPEALRSRESMDNRQRERSMEKSTCGDVVAETTGRAVPRKSPKARTSNTVVGRHDVTPDEDSAVQRVRTYWLETCHRAEIQPSQRRYDLTLKRLRDGFTVDQLREVILKASRDPYFQGANPGKKRLDDLLILLRDTETVEQWLARPTVSDSKEEARQMRFSPSLAPRNPGEPFDIRRQ